MRLTVTSTALATIAGLAAAGAGLAQSDQETTGRTDAAVAGDGQAGTCAQGYRTTDLNFDGSLSHAEVVEALGREYDDMDADEDDRVSRDEYIDCMSQVFEAPADVDKRAADDFDALDTDRSGTVSAEEYRAGVQRMWQQARRAGMPDAPEQAGAAGDLPEEAAEVAAAPPEVDGDDSAGPDMAAAGAGADAPEGTTAPERRLRRLVVIPVTRPDASPAGWPPERVAGQGRRLFVILDTNRDAELDKGEWAAAAPSADVSDMLGREFDAADTDGSGDLSRQEYMTHGAEKADAARQAAEDAGKDAAAADPADGQGDGEAAEAAQDGASAHPPIVYYRYEGVF